MKKIFAFFAFYICFCSLNAQEDVYFPGEALCSNIEKTLIFEETFTSIDELSEHWYSHFGTCSSDENDDQCTFARTFKVDCAPNVFTDFGSANFNINDDNNLEMILIEEDSSWPPDTLGLEVFDSQYTSGVIRSIAMYRGHKRYEIRCNLPPLQGTEKCSFWMWGTPQELDVFEWGGFIDENTMNPTTNVLVNVHNWNWTDSSTCFTPSVDTTQNGDGGGHASQAITFNPDVFANENGLSPLIGNMHTYAVEKTPMGDVFYIDDIEVHRVSRYKDKNWPFGECENLNLCDLDEGEYKLNPSYVPQINNDVEIIASHPASVSCDVEGSIDGSIYEIEHIRVYDLKLCNPFDKVYDEGGRNHMSYNNFNWNNVYVRQDSAGNGTELVIRNAHVSLQGQIYLEKGCRLHVENSTITSCDSGGLWEGIRMEDGVAQTFPDSTFSLLDPQGAPVVIIDDGSVIERAEIAVTTLDNWLSGVQCAFGNSCDFSGTIIVNEQSIIQHNDVGIGINFSDQSLTDISDAIFLDNGISIRSQQSENMNISDCVFDGGEQGLFILDSEVVGIEHCEFHNMTEEGIYVEASDVMVGGNNRFENNAVGIQAGGTFPGDVNLTVGIDGMGVTNVFENNVTAIRCEGIDGPLGSTIINNRITGTGSGSYGGMFLGANRASFRNNSIGDTYYGTGFQGTGSEANEVSCNFSTNNEQLDHYFIGANSGTQFLENISVGSVNNNYVLINASMPPTIVGTVLGAGAVPADNCFTTTGVDILATDVPFFPFTGNTPTYTYTDTTGMGVECVLPQTVLGNNIMLN